MGDGKEIQGGEIYVYLWLVHDDIWQKPTQDCKAIILKYRRKKKNFLKSHWVFGSFEHELLILLVWHPAINTYFSFSTIHGQ